jgi:hypothetical protein
LVGEIELPSARIHRKRFVAPTLLG